MSGYQQPIADPALNNSQQINVEDQALPPVPIPEDFILMDVIGGGCSYE